MRARPINGRRTSSLATKSPMPLREQQVQNAVVTFLPRLGYHASDLKSAHEHGVDIRAKHADYGRFFLIEVKGDPIRAKSPRSGRETRFVMALGQILTRILPRRAYRYGIAFPGAFEPLVLRRIDAGLARSLRLSFFFVSDGGTVRHVTWREIAEANEKARRVA
jgi:hypothetical protein